MIYLDNNATTLCDPDFASLIYQLLVDESLGNASSNHVFGWKANALYESALENIAQVYNALPDDVVITSGASEANNQAILGVAQSAYLHGCPRKKIIISSIEHKSIISAAQFACETMGYEIIFTPVTSEGIVDLNILNHYLNDDVLLVSIMAVNNEVGTVQPINEIGKLCKKYGIIFHVDGAQASYETIDMISSNIDMLSLSGHKMYAPIGVGTLIIDSMIQIKPQPLIHGGSQQAGNRGGTIPTYLAHAMSLAVTKLHQIKSDESNQLLNLRSYLLEKLKQENIEYIINGSMENRHPGNMNISLLGTDNHTLVQKLQPNVAISTGSACNFGVIQDSYVLKMMNLDSSRLKSAIRICIGRFNTQKDIDDFISLLVPALNYNIKSK